MAIENVKGTVLGIKATQGVGAAGSLKLKPVTLEVNATASAGSTYSLGRFSSKTRILGDVLSKIYFDQLANAGIPKMDCGIFGVNNNITDDDDALNDGITITASGSSVLVKNIADYGKQLWEFVNGQLTDPGGEFDIMLTLKDADVNLGGTITSQIATLID